MREFLYITRNSVMSLFFAFQPKTTSSHEQEDNSPGGINKPTVNLRPILAFSAYGLLIIGPLTHFFYTSLEGWVPWDPHAPFATMIKRVLVERMLFTPVLCAATVTSLDLFMNVSLIREYRIHTRAQRLINLEI